MQFGTAVASCSILTPGASDGIRSLEDTMKFTKEYPEPKVETKKI